MLATARRWWSRAGGVRDSLDANRITAAGQIFRMAMYHEGHPDGDDTIANRVEVFDEPRTIEWKPGTESQETGELSFGGWTWRYDLEATGASRTTGQESVPRCASTSTSRRSVPTTTTTPCDICPTSSRRRERTTSADFALRQPHHTRVGLRSALTRCAMSLDTQQCTPGAIPQRGPLLSGSLRACERHR